MRFGFLDLPAQQPWSRLTDCLPNLLGGLRTVFVVTEPVPAGSQRNLIGIHLEL